ncbi:MAG: restriction endonuclease subunit S [Pedobacter sp.]|nr:MAG: restriction endonuclease subunit S [Pedobacter sp.]
MRFKEFDESWAIKKLIDVAPLQRGFDLPVEKIQQGIFPVVFSNGILKFHNEFKVKAPGVVTGRSGTIGKVTFVENDYWPHNTSLWVTDFKTNIPKFIYYFYSKYNLKRFETGSGVPTLNRNDVHIQNEYFPNSREQSKIADFLTLIDAQIETQSKIIEEGKSLKEALIKKIFTRTIRFKDDFGNDYVEWQIKSLGELTNIVNKRNNKNDKLPVYSISNKFGFVPQGEQFEGIDSNDRGYDMKIYKIIKEKMFAYNPARINVGSIGYSGKLDNILISSLYVCFKTTEAINDDFLFQYVKMSLFNKQVLENMEGGVRSYLFYENFSRILVGLPCLEEQKKIAYSLSSLDKKIETERAILKQYETQKNYLLANLFM